MLYAISGEWHLTQYYKWCLCQISRTLIMLLFVYTTTPKRFVIFTCRYFKLSWNTTVPSQSNYSNFSCSSINTEISFWFRSLNDAYRKYTGIYFSWCLEHFLLRAVCMPAFKVAKVAGPSNHWPDQGPSNEAVIFYDAGFSTKLRSCRFVTS